MSSLMENVWPNYHFFISCWNLSIHYLMCDWPIRMKTHSHKLVPEVQALSCPCSTFHFPCRRLSLSSVWCSSAMAPGEMVAAGVFNRDDQLTSPLYVSGAYQPAPCPDHRFHFTGPPTPWLPLDVYTDPFIEDSLGLLCVCVCVCVHMTPLGHSTACLHWASSSNNAEFVPPDHSQTQSTRGGESVTKGKWSLRPQPPWCEHKTLKSKDKLLLICN